MALPYHIRRRGRTLFAVLTGVAILGYFGYHGVRGERGVGDWFEASKEITRLERQVTLNEMRIATLEHRVSLLREGSLDRDLLDERARHVLGLAHPDEIIVLGR